MLRRILEVSSVTETHPAIIDIAFSFKVTASLTRDDDHIFTNMNNTRGVSISKKSLNIIDGEAYLDLEYLVIGIQFGQESKFRQDQST